MDNALEIVKNKKALVLGGGGVLGQGCVAAIYRFIQLGFDLSSVKSVSGSSVGSIISTAIACGADINYIIQKMNSINFIRLKNHKSLLSDAYHLLKDFGAHDMEEVRNLISEVLIDLVGDKDITFLELYEKSGIWLTVTYLSFNYGRTIYADHIYEPDSLVREAVVKSSAIPIFYEAYFEKLGNKKEIIVDGGMMENYPMQIPKLQGYNHEDILGIKFVSPDERNSKDQGQPGKPEEWRDGPTNIINYLENLIQILRDQAMKVHVHKDDWKNTVKINIGTLTSTDFNMTEVEKAWLFKQGEMAADKYLEDLVKMLENDEYFE